jgi:hypothetical protein
LKQMKLFALPLSVLALLFANEYADDPNKDKLGPYEQLTSTGIPEGRASFDIRWVDSASSRYYLANRGNAKAIPKLIPPNIDVSLLRAVPNSHR